MRGNIITTNIELQELIKAIKKYDNNFGPMGSGGYSINHQQLRNGITLLKFSELDCAPAKCFMAFVKNDSIYANSIIDLISSALKDAGITFEIKKDVSMPKIILTQIKKLR